MAMRPNLVLPHLIDLKVIFLKYVMTVEYLLVPTLHLTNQRIHIKRRINLQSPTLISYT